MGSMRAGRRCPEIAAWVLAIARATSDFDVELVDLRDWRLPPDDEPGIPAHDGYKQPHTQAWSAKVRSARGLIIVTPQYNWGYPAPLKNALDHLYKEWVGKPVVIVSYGGHGGSKCAAQLLQVCEGLKMKVVPTMPAIVLSRDMVAGGPMSPEKDFAAYHAALHRALTELSAAMA